MMNEDEEKELEKYSDDESISEKIKQSEIIMQKGTNASNVNNPILTIRPRYFLFNTTFVEKCLRGNRFCKLLYNKEEKKNEN